MFASKQCASHEAGGWQSYAGRMRQEAVPSRGTIHHFASELDPYRVWSMQPKGLGGTTQNKLKRWVDEKKIHMTLFLYRFWFQSSLVQDFLDCSQVLPPPSLSMIFNFKFQIYKKWLCGRGNDASPHYRPSSTMRGQDAEGHHGTNSPHGNLPSGLAVIDSPCKAVSNHKAHKSDVLPSHLNICQSPANLITIKLHSAYLYIFIRRPCLALAKAGRRPGPPQVWSFAVATLAAPLLQHLELCLRQPFAAPKLFTLAAPTCTHSRPAFGIFVVFRKASHAISPGALAAFCLYERPLLFGTLKPL